MSNEFVMVPSDLAESAVDAFASIGMHDELDQLNEILAKPAEQHQGEPVEMEGATFMGEPNFHHSIEWYRTGISKHWKKICEQRVNIDALEKKLAEALGLLRIYESFPGYLIDHCEGDTIYEESLQYWLADHIKSLPASAEPSAPVERDEQAAVEEIAKLIYENWAGQPDYVPWVDSGNSLKQDEARRKARAALERNAPTTHHNEESE